MNKHLVAKCAARLNLLATQEIIPEAVNEGLYVLLLLRLCLCLLLCVAHVLCHGPLKHIVVALNRNCAMKKVCNLGRHKQAGALCSNMLSYHNKPVPGCCAQA